MLSTINSLNTDTVFYSHSVYDDKKKLNYVMQRVYINLFYGGYLPWHNVANFDVYTKINILYTPHAKYFMNEEA